MNKKNTVIYQLNRCFNLSDTLLFVIQILSNVSCVSLRNEKNTKNINKTNII